MSKIGDVLLRAIAGLEVAYLEPERAHEIIGAVHDELVAAYGELPEEETLHAETLEQAWNLVADAAEQAEHVRRGEDEKGRAA